MKLYLRRDVSSLALDVWGSEDAISTEVVKRSLTAQNRKLAKQSLATAAAASCRQSSRAFVFRCRGGGGLG